MIGRMIWVICRLLEAMEMFDYPHQTTLYPQPTEQASQAVFIETPAERELAIRRAVKMARREFYVPDSPESDADMIRMYEWNSDDIVKELMK